MIAVSDPFDGCAVQTPALAVAFHGLHWAESEPPPPCGANPTVPAAGSFTCDVSIESTQKGAEAGVVNSGELAAPSAVSTASTGKFEKIVVWSPPAVQ